MTDYQEFLAKKLTLAEPAGFDPPPLAEHLFPFQRDLVRWALRRGRAAIFADTGLGKTRMQVEWARRVHEHTGRDILIFAPLAVAKQTAREARDMGIEVTYARRPEDAPHGITITNYDLLDRFADALAGGRFGAVVLDESSILKNFTGKTRSQLIETCAAVPYRLACTATPSPNDFTELGNHAEFLGVMTRAEMLAMFFVHDGGSTQDWRLKGHAVDEFWRWVCSWGALVKRPSDLGYSDDGYNLPTLHVHEHVIRATPEHVQKAFEAAPAGTQGSLFVEPARGLSERRAARRGSIGDRVARCAEIVAAEPGEQWLVWGDLNDETDALAETIQGALEIRGSDTPERKEQRLVDFCEGRLSVLVTKAKIAGFGVNAQRSARMVFCGIPKDGSFEEWYQAVRRQWRFGQRREVHVHIVVHESQAGVVADLRRKEADAARMAAEMSAHTRAFVRDAVRGSVRESAEYRPLVKAKWPAWLRSEVA